MLPMPDGTVAGWYVVYSVGIKFYQNERIKNK